MCGKFPGLFANLRFEREVSQARGGEGRSCTSPRRKKWDQCECFSSMKLTFHSSNLHSAYPDFGKWLTIRVNATGNRVSFTLQQVYCITYTQQIKYILGLYLHRPATMMNFPVNDCLSGKQKVTRSDTFPFAPASRISNSMKPIRWWNNNNTGDKVPEDKGQRRRRCARSRVNSRGTGCRHTCPETTSGTSTTPDCWSARPYHLQGQEVTV